MRVSTDDVICGVCAPIARELMRHYHCPRPVGIACDVLGVGQAAARNRLSAFEIAGYLRRGGRESPANGAWWLTTVPAAARVVIGVAIVIAGIAGDLFESMLKRSAGVKDSSALIPGHGGVLDRVDSFLFAAPVLVLYVVAAFR